MCVIQNHITVQDNKDSIVSGLSFVLIKSLIFIILTGGLGPTDDDITREVLFDYFQTESIFDDEYWLLLKGKYRNAGLKISKSNKNQALRFQRMVRFCQILKVQRGDWINH